MGRTLFDRPLWRDPILLLWFLLLCLVALVALSQNTTWSGSVEGWRVLAFFRDFLSGAMSSYVVIALIPACGRWVWRSWRGIAPGSARANGHRHGRYLRLGESASAPAVSWREVWQNRERRSGVRYPRGAGSPGNASAGRASSGVATARTDSGGFPAWAERRTAPTLGGRRLRSTRPRFQYVRLVEPNGNIAESQVLWAAADTETVTINGVPGYPPVGSIHLPSRGEAVVLTAHGPGGTAVHVADDTSGVSLQLPEIQVHLPAGPGITLTSAVNLGLDDRAALAPKLESVLRGHDIAQTFLSQPTPFPGSRLMKSRSLREWATRGDSAARNAADQDVREDA